MSVSESDDEPVGEEQNAYMANEEGSIEDTEEEEEDVNMYEDDGFVVDEVVEGEAEGEESDDSSASKRQRAKRRKRRKIRGQQPDEDDLMLLAENNAEKNRTKAGRRLIRAAPRMDVAHDRDAQTFEHLDDFHDDDDEEGQSFRRDDRDGSGSMRGFGRGEDMGMGDFIVDEMAERRSKQHRHRPRDRAMTAAYQDALQEVAEIFGDVDELIELYEKAQRDRLAERDLMIDDQRMESVGDASFGHQHPSSSARKGMDEYDPEALAMHYLLPEDDEIRRQDVPERFQDRWGPDPTDFEYDLAAKWIYDCLFVEESKTPELELVENGQLELDGASPEVEYCSKSYDVPCKGHRVVRSVRVNDQKEKWRNDASAQSDLRKSIEHVLRHLYEDMEEIPYIATYRKQSCGELLCLAPDEVPNWTTLEEYNTHKDEGLAYPPPGSVQAKNTKMKRWQLLWAVYELSLKWRRLRVRIEKRVDAFVEAQNEHRDDQELVYAAHKCITQMRDAVTTEDADLADRRFRLVLAALKKKGPQSGVGFDGNMQRYNTYSNMGYRTIVAGMGIKQFLDLGVGSGEVEGVSHRPICCTAPLNDIVADIMQRNKGVVGVDAVLIGARHVAAMELASHPHVRQVAQRLYEEHATVSTTPTDLGEKVLDPFHVYGYIKRLVNKPVHSFKGDTFLRIIGASRSSYVNYTVEVSEADFKGKVLPALMASILRADLSPLCEGWDDFQKDVAQHLAMDHLFPSLRKAVIQKLSEKARSVVLNRMSETLWKFVIQGPFKPPIDENNYEEQDSMVRVCACCWGQSGKGQPSTVLVMLDNHGELKDMITLKEYSGFFDPPTDQDAFDQTDSLQDERKSHEADRVREFLMEHKPHVVVVGGAHMMCRKLVIEFELIRDEFLTEHSRFMVSIQGNMEVILLSEMIPAIWENSPAAKAELPDHSAHIRRAVALGRCLIDPLSVMASLRDYSDTILSVGLNDLQEWIIKEEKLVRIDQVMVTAMNQLGGELNLMANVQWRSHALQFVAGLGRRKAQGLLRLMHRNLNRMESRADLIEHEQLGAIVSRNCVGFLIINDSALPGMANIEFDSLDETRIHVDHYNLAKQLAMLAANTQDPDAALLELAEKSYLIRGIDVDEFNTRGMEQGRENLLSVLTDIGLELFEPFCDRRPVFAKPNELEIFYLLLNESPETMRPGKLVEAVVQSVEENDIRCALVQSHLQGTIKREHFSGSEDVQQLDLKSRVRRGDILTARLLGIEYKEFFVELSCRSMDLKNDERWEREYCTDEYYRVKTAEEKEQERLAKEAKQEKRFKARRIDHPLFKNISLEECVNLLSASPPDFAVLRPSAAGYEYVTLSFTAFSGRHGDIYLHRDLMEEPQGNALGPQTRLGLPLTMMVTSSRIMKFNDLDEVLPCFVDPYTERVKALQMHRKFKDRNLHEVEDILKLEKRCSRAAAAVYCLGVDYSQAGWFYIAAILNVNVRREYFMIVPEGYYYRKRVFKHLEHMIKEFKTHPEARTQPRPPQIPPVSTEQKTDSGNRFQGEWSTMQAGPSQPPTNPPPNTDPDASDEDLAF